MLKFAQCQRRLLRPSTLSTTIHRGSSTTRAGIRSIHTPIASRQKFLAPTWSTTASHACIVCSSGQARCYHHYGGAKLSQMSSQASNNDTVQQTKQQELQEQQEQLKQAEKEQPLKENSTKSNKKSLSSQWQITKRIMEFGKPESKLLGIAIVGLAVSTSVSLAFPYGLGMLVDAINIPDKAEAIQTLKTIGLGLTGLFAVSGLATVARVSAIQIAGQRVAKAMRQKLFDHYMRQDVAFFDKSKTGELVNRLSTDVTVVSDTLTSTIVSGFRSLAEAIGGITLLLFLSTKLTMAAVAVFPAIGIGAVTYGRYVKKMNKDYMDALAASTSTAQEKISSIRTVRQFAAESIEQQRYASVIQSIYELGKKLGIARGVFYGGILTATNLATLGVLAFGGLGVINGTLTVGQLTSFLIYSVYVGVSFNNLSSVYSDVMRAIGSSERMFEILDQVPSMPLEGGLKLNDIRGDISFHNVCFSYPARNDVSILNDFNVEISAGESIAIVGHSGSGKSTIAGLLSRLYDVDQGSIMIDGHDIRTLDPTWLRDHIGVVSQEPVIFDMSIRENIAYGCNRSDLTDEEVIAAAKMAHADDFISEMPDGYDTMVGERGVTLSGGQKQRIAIARVLLKNPKILILDESTSSLDAKSEQLIQDTLKHVMVGRTTIVIAHRLSTIQSAKKIVVLDGGRVAEIGSHSDLMKINGKYRDLVSRQMNAWQHTSETSSE